MCIAIVCFPFYNVISIEITIIFPIKPFFNMRKKTRQKFIYPEKKKTVFKVKQKAFFIIF